MFKVSSINNLQDARYCAAEAIEFIGFSVKQGDNQALIPQKVREITGWLFGSKVLIEYDSHAIESLKELLNTMPFYGVELSQEEWEKGVFVPPLPVWVMLNDSCDFQIARSILQEIRQHHSDSKVILRIETPTSLVEMEAIQSSVLLHFPSPSLAKKHINHPLVQGFAGIYIGKETFMESGEGLDYDAIGELIALGA